MFDALGAKILYFAAPTPAGPTKINPGITPNTNAIPGVSTAQSFVGTLVQIGVILSVAALVVGAIGLGFAKVSRSNQAMGMSSTVLIWAIGVASVIGSASAIIGWATGINWGGSAARAGVTMSGHQGVYWSAIHRVDEPDGSHTVLGSRWGVHVDVDDTFAPNEGHVYTTALLAREAAFRKGYVGDLPYPNAKWVIVQGDLDERGRVIPGSNHIVDSLDVETHTRRVVFQLDGAQTLRNRETSAKEDLVDWASLNNGVIVRAAQTSSPDSLPRVAAVVKFYDGIPAEVIEATTTGQPISLSKPWIEYLSKPACAQCGAADRTMAKKGINPDQRRDMSQDSEALQLALELGHRQAPVTIVRNGAGDIIDHWSGFRPDKIMELARAAAPQIQSNTVGQHPRVGTSPPDLAHAI